MKKTITLFLAIAALILTSAYSLSAQTMPKVSDNTNTYWYYLKSQGAADRVGKVITANGSGLYLGTSPWNNQNTWAKFKVVAGTSGGYDIVTMDSKFLNSGVNGNATDVNVFSDTDNTDWVFTATADSRGTGAFRLTNEDGQFFQLKTGAASLRTDYGTEEDNNLWNFVAADELGFMLSEGTTEYWYAIQNLQNSPTDVRHKAYLAINADDNKPVTTKTDMLLWKFEESNTVGKYYVISENGRYLSFTLEGDPERYTTLAVADESCEIDLYPTFGVHSSKQDYIFVRDFEAAEGAQVLHPTNYAPFTLMNYTAQDQASKWMINSAADAVMGVVNQANALLANTVEGQDPGKFPSAARAALQTAIDDAMALIDGGTVQFADAADVQAAMDTYKTMGVVPEISTEGNEKWYFFQGQRPANTYLTNTGAGAPLQSNAVIPDDTQLWKLVGTADAFAMVNKATGEYLNTDVVTPQPVTSVAQMPANTLKFVVSDIYTDNVARFWIENSDGSTPGFRLHAGNGNAVLNYTGNRYDNSSWLIMDYGVALKVFLQEGIVNANDLYAATTEGDAFGEYPAQSRADLTAAILDAQGVMDNSSATPAEVEAATLAINAAITAYKEAAVGPTGLLSTNADNYRWYYITSNAVGKDYCFGKVISVGDRVINNDPENPTRYTYLDKADPMDDTQLFRFELTVDETKIQNIVDINGNYMAVNGVISADPVAVGNFELVLLSDYESYNIQPRDTDPALAALHAQQTGEHIVNWAGGVESASAWIFEFAKETPKVPTGIEKPKAEKYQVIVVNRVISVKNVENFEVYSIVGQRQNEKAPLAPGIYIVRINNETQKVLVK